MSSTTAHLEVFSLKTQLLSSGRSDRLVALADDLWITMKVYASGGENDLHQHPTEDHAFVVLDGQATFYDGDETPRVVHRHHGVLIPKGTFYRFQSTAEEPLVMLRVGGGTMPYGTPGQRISPDGTEAVGKPDDRAGQMPVVPIPNRFFGDETREEQTT
jgi:mannose-6-phosphate isomerase-like protein (cupin superfamily)